MRNRRPMLYMRGNIWWTKFEVGGTCHRISTGEENRRAAEKKARKIRVDVESEIPRGKQQGVKLEILQALDLQRTQNSGLDESNVKTLEYRWQKLIEFFTPTKDINQITLSDICVYEGQRRKDGLKGQTIRREVQALVRGLRLAKRDGLITTLPFDPDDLTVIKSDPPNKQQQGKLWSINDINKILEHLSGQATRAGIREKCELVMLTGLRFKELCRLEKSWVDGRLLKIPADGSKTKKPRMIPLCKEAVEIINAWAPWPGDKPNKALTLASRRAGFKMALTLRDCRKFYLSHIAALSGDPVVAQHLGGHTNIATTGLYLAIDNKRAEKASKAISDFVRCNILSKGRHSRVGTIKNSEVQI